MGRRGARNCLENHIKLVILYMEYRQVANLGYLPYSHYKNLIRWCLSNPDKLMVRRIFDIMNYRGIFSVYSYGKKHHNKKYLFNPHDRPHKMRMTYRVDWLD
jgi:hypothetical protein